MNQRRQCKEVRNCKHTRILGAVLSYVALELKLQSGVATGHRSVPRTKLTIPNVVTDDLNQQWEGQLPKKGGMIAPNQRPPGEQ
jgi:hypothetical protein